MTLSWWTSVSLGLTFATGVGVGSATAINEVVLFNDTVRVQALSPTLLRVEPVGPLGFEDRNTFFISGNRSAFAGVVLTKRNESVKEAFVSNEYWTVHVQALGGRTCSLPKQGMAAQVSGPQHGLQVKSQQECTALCRNEESCMGYNLRSNLCTLLSGWYVLLPDNETVFGKCSSKPSFTVFTETQVLFDSSEVLDKDTPGDRNLLFWPSPLEKAAYTIEDFPRFFLPEWGPTPMMHVGLDPKTNAVRDGLASQHRACEVVHPVQGLQQNFLRIKMDRKAAEMGQLYGSHMMMRRKMEEAILSRHQRLPGLKSHLVGLSTLVNMDEEFGFEDVLDDPCMREEPTLPVHDAMEIKLFGRAL